MRRLSSSITAILLPLCMATAPAYAEPSAPGTPPPASAPAAEQVLAKVTGLLSAKTSTSRTPVGHGAPVTSSLLELRAQIPDLDRTDRTAARSLFARPDTTEDWDPVAPGVQDPDGSVDWSDSERAVAKTACANPATGTATPYCVHWVPDGAAIADKSNMASPQEVQDTFDAMARVWSREIAGLAYQRPVSDDTLGNPAGEARTGLLDVYLSDTREIGAFGYAVPETEDVATQGYLVIDNDFEGFGDSKTPKQFRQVTLAHEFFHIVQFGYDSYEDGWLMESTATWMEEQVYDAINDNRAYLSCGSVALPTQSLDTFNGCAEYGTWAFHERYTQQFDTTVVRRVWENARTRGWRQSLDTALSARGWSLTRAFGQFGGAVLAPRYGWDEGAVYPSARRSGNWTLTSTSRTTGDRSVTLKHLAGAAYDIRPGSSLTATSWKLSVRVDAPAGQSTAYVLVTYKDGTAPKRLFVTLNSNGNAATSVPFSSSKVSRVSLHVGNASGVDGRTTKFRATAWR